MRGGLAFLAFTDRGFALAQKLAEALGGSAARCGRPDSLGEWTKRHFAQGAGLVYVGAVGIAVRAIAPYVEKKWEDPAVVAVDECANFAVALLSGHLGGANDLARAIGRACGAQPVITTATDVNGLFPIDQWARRQGLRVENPWAIRAVSARLLAGGTVRLGCPWPIQGEIPPGVELTSGPPAEALVTVKDAAGDALLLVPNIVVLGVGCRRGTSRAALEAALEQFLARSGLLGSAICGVASIDLKAEEPGLLEFCRSHGWDFQTRGAAELAKVPGAFTPSPFVRQVTGVDNVCERSAAAVSGGPVLAQKFTAQGVTLAAAQKPLSLTWDWGQQERDERKG